MATKHTGTSYLRSYINWIRSPVRRLDQLEATMLEQTGNVRPNPDEQGYPQLRARIVWDTIAALDEHRMRYRAKRRTARRVRAK